MLLRRAGFRAITMRGDTDFSQTQHLDRWDADGVQFVFGYQAAANLREKAGKLPKSAWSTFERKQRHEVKTEPRTRPRDVKEDIVLERELYSSTTSISARRTSPSSITSPARAIRRTAWS